MVSLGDAFHVLTRTPAAIRGLLTELPEEWSGYRAQPDSWSPYDVLGHLIDGERTNWIPRARVIVVHGAAEPFRPFDREGPRTSSADLEALLDTFETVRRQSLADLEEMHLVDDDLARKGTHPDFGVVTLGELLASWCVHDLSHVAQIAETMAKRYRVDIGPWRAYLPVVDRPELSD